MRPEAVQPPRQGPSDGVVAGGSWILPPTTPEPRSGVTDDVGWTSIPYDAVLAVVIERGEPSASPEVYSSTSTRAAPATPNR